MHSHIIRTAASSIGAVEDERIPGLWHAPGHPELTTGQMMDLFGRMVQNMLRKEREALDASAQNAKFRREADEANAAYMRIAEERNREGDSQAG